MKITAQNTTATQASYTLVAETSELTNTLKIASKNLSENLEVPGFRRGKAPSEIVAKHVDQARLSKEFLNQAVADLYDQLLKTVNLQVVGEPKINVTKFVPYSTLEVKIELPIIKNIKLPTYSSLKLTKKAIKLSDGDIKRNLHALQLRLAELAPLSRAAKDGDLVVIDFQAKDLKTKKDLPSAGAKDYRLLLGEGSFIAGFESNVIGLKKGAEKEFKLTFPKDYFDKSFASKVVLFNLQVKEVNSVKLPKLDDQLAQKVGPFQTLDQLKKELKKQLQIEADKQATIDLENRILNQLAEKTVVELNDDLISGELEFLNSNAKQSALQQGQTWKEYLASRGQNETEFEEELKKSAIARIKGGLAIGEIAKKEKLTVSDQELEVHIERLKSQYQDSEMLAEIDKPNNRRDLAMRVLTEKVLDFIQKS